MEILTIKLNFCFQEMGKSLSNGLFYSIVFAL